MNENWLIEDFASAVQQLEAALLLHADNDVVKAGCIQYFEFCFELAWKSVKVVSASQGAPDCLSPKPDKPEPNKNLSFRPKGEILLFNWQ